MTFVIRLGKDTSEIKRMTLFHLVKWDVSLMEPILNGGS